MDGFTYDYPLHMKLSPRSTFNARGDLSKETDNNSAASYHTRWKSKSGNTDRSCSVK